MTQPSTADSLATTPPPRSAPRFVLGWLVFAAGTLVLLFGAWRAIGVGGAVGDALLAGSIAAVATALGVLPMLLTRAPSLRTHDTMLGFGAGVMLAACCFSLLMPALAAAKGLGYGAWHSAIGTGIALLAGAVAVMLLERLVPHEHFFGGAGTASAQRIRRLWLFVAAIVLHNIPEGLAIGVAAAGTDVARASALAVGISIQDVPEGLVVALALHGAGYRRRTAALVGAASGLVEPVAAVLGAMLVSHAAGLLPWGLAFAGGAMLFVVSHEVIPESHRQGHERFATAGLLLGFVVMLVLDTALA